MTKHINKQPLITSHTTTRSTKRIMILEEERTVSHIRARMSVILSIHIYFLFSFHEISFNFILVSVVFFWEMVCQCWL